MSRKKRLGAPEQARTREFARSTSGIMFLDIKGYSSLEDRQLKILAEKALPNLQSHIQGYGYDYLNTWGDAIVVASQDVRKITQIAAAARDFFNAYDWADAGIPKLKARISLHHGSIWRGDDVFSVRGMISGQTVNLAARIEPICSPGQIWATKDFISILSRESQELFKWSSLGIKELPKGAGHEELYVIFRWDEPDPSARGKEVAVAVVAKDGMVLVVRRAGNGIPQWQFPAGQLKPDSVPEKEAAETVLEETGVRCEIIGPVASRHHPDTKVYCHYFYARWVAGEAVNKDPKENDQVAWVLPDEALKRFTTDVDPAVKTLLRELAVSQ